MSEDFAGEPIDPHKLTDIIKAQAEQIAALDGDKLTLWKHIGELQAEITDLKDRATLLDEQLSQAVENVRTRNARIDHVEKEIASVYDRLQAEHNRIAFLEEQEKYLRWQLDEDSKRIGGLRQDKAKMFREKIKYRDRVTMLETAANAFIAYDDCDPMDGIKFMELYDKAIMLTRHVMEKVK